MGDSMWGQQDRNGTDLLLCITYSSCHYSIIRELKVGILHGQKVTNKRKGDFKSHTKRIMDESKQEQKSWQQMPGVLYET